MHGTTCNKNGIHKRSVLRRTISALLSVILILSVFPSVHTYAETNPAPYRDTEGHWASSYIAWAVKEDLANGYEDGTFQPDKPVTEAEFMALLLRAYGVMSKSDSAGAAYGTYPIMITLTAWDGPSATRTTGAVSCGVKPHCLWQRPCEAKRYRNLKRSNGCLMRKFRKDARPRLLKDTRQKAESPVPRRSRLSIC
ncbi:S-layer homology domain-containing protein [Paenibacillus soyae]|uniref:S-layer homology domain-containing protein n=1 Tax=Paenibacillus soyae TaxID=2969249 RepID=UPI00353012AE